MTDQETIAYLRSRCDRLERAIKGALRSQNCHFTSLVKEVLNEALQPDPSQQTEGGDETCATLPESTTLQAATASSANPVASNAAPQPSNPVAERPLEPIRIGRGTKVDKDGKLPVVTVESETPECLKQAAIWFGHPLDISQKGFVDFARTLERRAITAEEERDYWKALYEREIPELVAANNDRVCERDAAHAEITALNERLLKTEQLAATLTRERDDATKTALQAQEMAKEITGQLSAARAEAEEAKKISAEYREMAYLFVLVADGMQGGRDRIRLLATDRDHLAAELASERTCCEQRLKANAALTAELTEAKAEKESLVKLLQSTLCELTRDDTKGDDQPLIVNIRSAIHAARQAEKETK